jgi:hypothetical protein
MENDPRSPRLNGSKKPDDLSTQNEPFSSRLSGSNPSNNDQNEPSTTRLTGSKIESEVEPNQRSTESELRKQELRAEILNLWKSGLSTRKISDKIGLARNTVTRYLHISAEDPSNNITINRSTIAGGKWSKAINTIYAEILPYYLSRGNPFPSLRTVFYDLEERTLIGGDACPSDYKLLSRYTADCRIGAFDDLPGVKQGYKYPKLDINCFADETRLVLNNFNNDAPTEATKPPEPNEYLKNEIKNLLNAPWNYTGIGSPDSPGGYWYNQPEYAEVMIEKFSLKPSFISFLKGRYVNISINRGYSSLSFLNENCIRLKEKVAKYGADHVHVLYCGDRDPSGDDMVRYLKKYLNILGVPSRIIERITLTKDQIDYFHIPTKTITGEPKPGKKRPDPRAKKWMVENGNQTAHIESFIASKRDVDLEKIVQKAVDQYHNKDIFNTMKEKYTGKSLSISQDLDSAKQQMNNIITKMFGFGWIYGGL